MLFIFPAVFPDILEKAALTAHVEDVIRFQRDPSFVISLLKNRVQNVEDCRFAASQLIGNRQNNQCHNPQQHSSHLRRPLRSPLYTL